MTGSRRTAPARVLRRTFVLPLILAVQVTILVSCPLWFLLAGVASLLRWSSRPWRSVALVVAFGLIELRTVAVLARGADDLEALVTEVLEASCSAMRRVLKVPLVIEEGSAGVSDVAGSNGLIVLARHCGPGDSIYVAWLIGVHYGLSLRVVLKGLLRLEPAIDLAGDRLPFCFIGDDPSAAPPAIAKLAETLSAGRALLLFPEGGNFTWQRWRSGLRYLASRGDRARLRQAAARTHTLPPRTGGTLAALQAAPHADVLIVAHSGFSDDGRDRPWWRVPIGRDFVMRTMLYRFDAVPRDEEGALSFLDTAWAQVDTWVEAQADLQQPTADLERPPAA